MAKELIGCCSSIYKTILICFNVLLFIIGLLVTIFAAVVKTKGFKDLIGLKELNDIINLAQINIITILFLSIGVFVIFISLVGLLGLWCLNKFLLYFYELIVILLFLAHGISLIVLVFDRSAIEKEFKKGMVKLVDNLNTLSNTTEKYDYDCQQMKALSNLFNCCGDKSPSDFYNNTFTLTGCCAEKSIISTGCTQKTIDDITKNAVNYLIIPSLVMLGAELAVITLTPLIIKKIRRGDGDDSSKGITKFENKNYRRQK